MSSNEQPELNPEFETAELRRQMMSTGISDYLEDDLRDIELQSSSRCWRASSRSRSLSSTLSSRLPNSAAG